MRLLTVIGVVLLVAVPAQASTETPMAFDLALALGYALPVGSSEEGARLSDQTFGLVPLDLTATYRLSAPLAFGVWGRYGPSIPTLCAAPSDCVSSLGRDVGIAVRARIFTPRLWSAEPYVDIGMGYEWFVSKLVDSDVRSSHSYEGPLLLSSEIACPFELGKGWTLGPVLGLDIGTFVDSQIDGPGLSRDLGVHDRSLHAWLSMSARVSFRF